MRKSLIFVVFFSFLSYSQEGITDYLLVEKDSSSFYTFTKKGVFLSSFNANNELNFVFNPYSVPPPKSFTDIPTDTLLAVNLNGVIYLLYPGGAFYTNTLKMFLKG